MLYACLKHSKNWTFTPICNGKMHARGYNMFKRRFSYPSRGKICRLSLQFYRGIASSKDIRVYIIVLQWGVHREASEVVLLR
jgi:hypothetical protein